MNQPTSPRLLSRRDFFRLSAAAGLTAAGGYMLAEYTPWLNYDQKNDQVWRPMAGDTTVRPPWPELLRYATLAANGHNTQPWRFAINQDAIAIYPDHGRGLPVVDPQEREMWISLGCALENFVLAARAGGYASEVSYPDTADHIDVRLTADTPQRGALFDAIPLRQNTRSAYDGRLVKNADLDQVRAVALEPGVRLHFVTNPQEMEKVTEFVTEGNLSQYADTAFVEELIFWLRFTKKEALAALDGLYSACSGNPNIPRWLGKLFVAGTKPQQQADADAIKLQSSPGAVVIASDADDKTSWVRTGQVYQRLALTMTALNIKSALLNQPIEVPEIRPRFQSAMGLGNALPQLLVRFGYADALPKSLRRPVEQVMV